MWTKTTTRPNSHNAKDKPTAAHIPSHPISQTSTTQKAVLVWRYATFRKWQHTFFGVSDRDFSRASILRHNQGVGREATPNALTSQMMTRLAYAVRPNPITSGLSTGLFATNRKVPTTLVTVNLIDCYPSVRLIESDATLAYPHNERIRSGGAKSIDCVIPYLVDTLYGTHSSSMGNAILDRTYQDATPKPFCRTAVEGEVYAIIMEKPAARSSITLISDTTLATTRPQIIIKRIVIVKLYFIQQIQPIARLDAIVVHNVSRHDWETGIHLLFGGLPSHRLQH